MVLNGESRTALGIVRSLVQKGLSIVVGSGIPFGRANFCNGVKKHFVYEDKDQRKAHSIIFNHVKSLRPKVLMPVGDFDWSIVYNFYHNYEHITTVVPNPGKELFNNLHNKSHLAKISEKYGVSTPKTYTPKTIKDALSMSDELPYPILLKPKRGAGGDKIKRVAGKTHLYDALLEYSEMPIIQESINGEDLELTLLCLSGAPLAGSVYKSLRNAPLPFGPPSACRTIKDQNLMEIGISFLKKLNYNGIAHLDFRRDINDNQAKLLDFNVRFAGTNEVSLFSEIDFGYKLYNLAMGESVTPSFEYKTDIEFRWYLFNELRHLIKTPNRWKTVKNHFRFKNVSTDISFADPLPSIVRFAELAKRLFITH